MGGGAVANTKTKVEKLGLAAEVDALILAGYSAHRIFAELAAGGHPLSESGVQRYMAKVRDSVRATATAMFDAHVEQHLPGDLEHLEQIQAQAKAWHETAPKDKVVVLAEAEAAVSGAIGRWCDLVINAVDLDRRKSVVKQIIAEALEIVTRDDRGQRARVEAMGVAIKTIETKLRNVGALQDDRKGKIVIMDRSAEYAPVDPSKPTVAPSFPLKLSVVRPTHG